MSRPVSILVWRDARTDPITDLPDTKRILVEREDGNIGIGTVMQLARPGFTPIVRWADLPVVSDLTDDDVRNVALWALDGERIVTGTTVTADRLRAALGGEKEEA